MKNCFIDKKWFRTDVFEIVDTFPDGYIVWPIGRDNFPHVGYIPLAKPAGKFSVSTDGLKALKVESEEVALHVLKMAIRGPEDITSENIDKYTHI